MSSCLSSFEGVHFLCIRTEKASLGFEMTGEGSDLARFGDVGPFSLSSASSFASSSCSGHTRCTSTSLGFPDEDARNKDDAELNSVEELFLLIF